MYVKAEIKINNIKVFKTYIIFFVWNRIQFGPFKISKYSFSLV